MEEANKSVTHASFVCEKCKGIPSMDQIIDSAIDYGLIWLNNDENTWLGFNCPLCEKPWINIKKFKYEDINPLRLELEYTIADNTGDLVYHSFPFSVHHPLKELVQENKLMERLILSVDQIEEEAVYLGGPENPDYRRKLYSSYSFGSKALGPAIAIWWYGDADIDKLASFESESGLRAFPRYRVYDSIYSAVDSFCWRERLHVDYIKELRNSWPITYLLSSSTKKDLTKTFDFMHILDMPHLEYISAYPTDNKPFEENSRECPKRPMSEVEIISDLCSTRNIDYEHEKISSVVWANFTKDYVQDLLKKRSEKFIDEYIALSRRIDFTYKAVWELKEKYLSDLVKAIKSPRERQKLEQKGNEHHRFRVLEAEKSFPGVKIISQNAVIDEIKIWISRLPKAFAKPEAFLLLGEKGVGKGLFADAIHESFVRAGREGKSVKFDCGNKVATIFESELFGYVKGAHSEAKKDHKGYLEKAKNGTIFIDEIGNLPMSLQSAMLGFLQDRKFQPVGSTETKDVNAIVVLATNKDLDAEIKNGNFRADLYDRFRFLKRIIPPLRSRKEDIHNLFYHFINMYDEQRHNEPSLEEFTVTSDCLKALIDYHWPGNVREVEGVVKGIFANRGGEDRSPIDVRDIQELLSSSSASEDPVHPKSNEPSHPIERRYFHLPEDSVLIELKKQGMKNREIAEKFKVAPETVSRRISKIAKTQN